MMSKNSRNAIVPVDAKGGIQSIEEKQKWIPQQQQHANNDGETPNVDAIRMCKALRFRIHMYV